MTVQNPTATSSSADGAGLTPDDVEGTAAGLVDVLGAIDDDGWYSTIEVVRPWSAENPRLTGEFSRTDAIRRYMRRELAALLRAGARITVRPARPALPFDDPSFFAALDEDRVDVRSKKLFLFGPERMGLSVDRLGHYTGTAAEAFQRHVIFTNYAMHVEAFLERYPDAVVPSRPGAQMPAYHHLTDDGDGVSLVNIGVGPANAKTATDHVAVLRPDTMIMIGHCGGLRNHQQKGDFVLATGYQRFDHVLDEVLPLNVPVIPNHRLNTFLLEALEAAGAEYRIGTVHTTDNRNWELNQRTTLAAMQASRSVAVDMESATIAANGFRYRVPNATLLCVSDKPLHGSPKLSAGAQQFYEASKRQHLGIALSALDRVRREHPGGLPSQEIRSVDEPLFGGPSDT
ncbi:AMP nucleosidase [Actinomycetospora sp. TBRC 11914]|uniref:AMP nucleosidase n=1 Tax=Actinomycetospora sp. TBRC 11914 TaxID=2729387 RepID=UPI0028973288|nr:AMP nucleosidase [Actinomycetospora sp. TBRC 11914]